MVYDFLYLKKKKTECSCFTLSSVYKMLSEILPRSSSQGMNITSIYIRIHFTRKVKSDAYHSTWKVVGSMTEGLNI